MGDLYTESLLVRVVCDGQWPFCAGLLIDRTTQRVVFTAPILRHYIGQPADKVRQSFQRLGWRATIVKRGAAQETP